MGATVHFLKSKKAAKRPIRNYVHAVLGLLTIGLGLYQAHQGGDEWEQTTGFSPPFPRWSGYLYLVQVIVRRRLFHGLLSWSNVPSQTLPILYFGALLLLPKQFRQEKAIREQAAAEEQAADPCHLTSSRPNGLGTYHISDDSKPNFL